MLERLRFHGDLEVRIVAFINKEFCCFQVKLTNQTLYKAIKSGKSTLVQFLLKTGINLTDFVKDKLKKLYLKVVPSVLCLASSALPWCSCGILYSHSTIG